MVENKEKQLQKEIDRLLRRNKILTKRIKKIQLENESLVDELNEIEAVRSVRVVIQEACPHCGSGVSKTTIPSGRLLVMCDRYPTNCKYKEIKEIK